MNWRPQRASIPLHFGYAAPRGIEVIRRMTTAMQWQPTPSLQGDMHAPLARGRGMAYVHYKHTETYVAMGMEAVDSARALHFPIT